MLRQGGASAEGGGGVHQYVSQVSSTDEILSHTVPSSQAARKPRSLGAATHLGGSLAGRRVRWPPSWRTATASTAVICRRLYSRSCVCVYAKAKPAWACTEQAVGEGQTDLRAGRSWWQPSPPYLILVHVCICAPAGEASIVKSYATSTFQWAPAWEGSPGYIHQEGTPRTMAGTPQMYILCGSCRHTAILG